MSLKKGKVNQSKLALVSFYKILVPSEHLSSKFADYTTYLLSTFVVQVYGASEAHLNLLEQCWNILLFVIISGYYSS